MKFEYEWRVRTTQGLKTGKGSTRARDEGSAELKIQEQIAKKLKISSDKVIVTMYEVCG